MPRYIKEQTAFLGGEQSPFLAGRSDIEQYKFGCKLLRDATLLPQGGWIRRAGARLVEKMPTVGDNQAFKIWGFTRDINTKYLLVFMTGKLLIYRDAVKVHEIEDTDFTEDNVTEIDTAQLADTMIITHRTFAPKELRWKGDDVSWTLEDVTFSTVPKYFFNDSDSPAGKSERQKLFLKSTGVGSTFTIALGGYETNQMAVLAGDWNLTGKRIEEELLALSITPSSGISVVADWDDTKPSGELEFTVFFQGEARDNWPTLTGNFIYRSDRPNEYIYATVEQEGESREEPVWSDLRGWPKVCAFFENRLIFASTKTLPQNIWCSRIGEYFDFNEGEGEDSDAINRTIATNINNEIVNVTSSRELQVLTTNGEHYNPYAMTPNAFGMPSQTTNGSKGARPQVINGATYFIQRKGNGVRQFVYTDTENAYNTSSVALLSEHLIRDVVDTAKTQGTLTDADYLYCLNSDGTIAVMNVLRGQNILAWSLWESKAGLFHAIGYVEEEFYCIMKCADGFYLCQFDDDTALDMAQKFTNAEKVTLANQGAYSTEVVSVADRMYMGEFDPAQEIDLARERKEIEVGVNFIPRCIPNPVDDNVTNGSNRNKKKRPVRAWLQMVDAVGFDLVYNGKVRKIAYRSLPLSFEDPAPKPFTGTKEVRLIGYAKEMSIEIRQSLPFKKSAVLSLMTEIKTV